jgi:Ser/Thr protein kinase RdoA (MazF antagonist)
MTFWTYVELDREMPPTDEEAAVALPALHRALEKFPGHLPYLGVVLEELPHWLHWLEQNHALSAADLIALRQAHWNVAQTLQKNRSRLRPLHGDAHRGNLLRTSRGLLWTDFEDACTGPIAWDVAILLARDPANAESTLAAYPEAPSWNELLPFMEARELVTVIYWQVLGTRFPERGREAKDALAAWHRKFSF